MHWNFWCYIFIIGVVAAIVQFFQWRSVYVKQGNKTGNMWLSVFGVMGITFPLGSLMVMCMMPIMHNYQPIDFKYHPGEGYAVIEARGRVILLTDQKEMKRLSVEKNVYIERVYTPAGILQYSYISLQKPSYGKIYPNL